MSHQVFVAVVLKVDCCGVTATTGTEAPRACQALSGANRTAAVGTLICQLIWGVSGYMTFNRTLS